MSARRRAIPREPAPPSPGAPCAIVFGHNATTQQVLMQFSIAADRLIFSPDDARHVAAQLLVRADLADGTKVSG